MEMTGVARAIYGDSIDTITQILADRPNPQGVGVSLAIERIIHLLASTGLEVTDDSNASDAADGHIDLIVSDAFDGRQFHELPHKGVNALMHHVNTVAASAPVQVSFRLSVHLSYEVD